MSDMSNAMKTKRFQIYISLKKTELKKYYRTKRKWKYKRKIMIKQLGNLIKKKKKCNASHVPSSVLTEVPRFQENDHLCVQ